MTRARASRLLPTVAALASLLSCGGHDQPAGEIQGERRDGGEQRARASAQRAAADELGERPGSSRILFGDLHVHTTYSIDAFMYSLPIFGGEGAHPPADACDFARLCSQLDFFALTDHAEGLLPDRWTRSIESVRQCDALSGDPADPDLVAFMGFEWTQTSPLPETHYGHKNVIFEGLGDDDLPARPITSLGHGTVASRAKGLWLANAVEWLVPRVYADFLWLSVQLAGLPDCEIGRDTRELPRDCRENAPTPGELFEKLAQWGLPALVIPHGLAWGIHAPPGATLANQLDPAQNVPARQRLVEVYSGHGNSEEYRSYPEHVTNASGEPVCPEPTPDYLPCCWRAGEIVRERCGDLPEAECEERVREARQLALEAGTEPHRIFPDARPEDWLDCDQCRDCFKPASNLRPGESAQYALALSHDGADGAPLRFRWGLIASSDDHKAQPGTGYKQLARERNSDARGFASPWTERLLRPYAVGRQQDPRRAQAVPPERPGFRGLLDVERGASFLYPGGLVAVHADGRDRRSIWEALERREVYGTSGPRILLWFDLRNGPQGTLPMGGATELAETPRFEVRAAGAFEEQPGCSDATRGRISADRLQKLCGGECYNPGERRHPISAVEIVRIRPQSYADEPVDELIEDPWRRFECEPDPAGCVVRFEDPDFVASGRDAVYYARALQEPTPAINGANLRTRFDADGNAVSVEPCYAGFRAEPGDDCLAPVQERAWSSPIFVDRAR